MRKKISKNTVMQAVRFGTVGICNTVIDYVLFYVFLVIVNLHKGIAQIIATAFAMCGSYFFNRKWTFKKHGRGNAQEIVKFLSVNIFAMLVVIFFTHLFYDVCHIENLFNILLKFLSIKYIIKGNVAIIASKACASVFSVIVNFVGNKFWVFKSNSAE